MGGGDCSMFNFWMLTPSWCV